MSSAPSSGSSAVSCTERRQFAHQSHPAMAWRPRQQCRGLFFWLPSRHGAIRNEAETGAPPLPGAWRDGFSQTSAAPTPGLCPRRTRCGPRLTSLIEESIEPKRTSSRDARGERFLIWRVYHIPPRPLPTPSRLRGRGPSGKRSRNGRSACAFLDLNLLFSAISKRFHFNVKFIQIPGPRRRERRQKCCLSATSSANYRTNDRVELTRRRPEINIALA
jgi:hypothetical protein